MDPSKGNKSEVRWNTLQFVNPRGAIDPALNDFRYPSTVDFQVTVEQVNSTDLQKTKRSED